jgi:hypothetical protein
MSSRGASLLFTGRNALAVCGLLAGLVAAMPAAGQYTGQVTKAVKDNPELRAVAVLEWTGEAGKPKTCRIVPVTVYDNGKLEDGGIYLARPEPIALAGEVEYELKQDGKTVGLFDIENSGREQGSWVGYGKWKDAPKEQPKAEIPKVEVEDEDDDHPVLHRKKHPDEAPAGGGASSGASSGGNASSSGDKSGSGSSAGSGAPGPPSDPDRPVMHKKTTSDTGSATGSTSDKTTPNSPGGTSAGNPGGSVLDNGPGSVGGDSGQPELKKGKKKQEDIGHVESLPEVTDHDRPRLKRGKSNGGDNLQVIPSLMGLPPDMQQAVAVSDAKTRPDHPWAYSWANQEDEDKMKAGLEDMARDALGLNTPPPPQKPAPKKMAARKSAKPAPPPEPPAPAPLGNEQFRVFELAYGSGATLVLTADSGGDVASRKFVTLIAQPDLYGNILVLLKSVAYAGHLDETPRMRLVDAVDVLADNRGELLFEMRGDSQRQFALYRVLRGRAEKLFVSGGDVYGTQNGE